MKNKTIILLSLSIFLLLSCSDWTEMESLDMEQPNIAEQNPQLYETYIKGLKDFKNSDHKVTYVWFDNSEKTPFSRAHHIVDLPDSIDYISLMSPENLADWELAEMDEIRKEKNTKVIFTMNFDEMKLNFDNMVADLMDQEYEEDEERPETPDFINFLVDSVTHTLSLVKEYNYDGISLAYKGKSIIHMTDKEKLVHKGYEKAFIGIAEDWKDRNQDKMIVYEGYPQNLLNKDILESCEHIILPLTFADSKQVLNYEFISAKVDNIPLDRFVIAATTASLEQADQKTGYWMDGSRALQGTAEWASAPQSGVDIAGIAIYHVSNDYFNSDKTYRYSRNAINTINPSPKK